MEKNVDREEKQKDYLLTGHRSGMLSEYSGEVGEALDQIRGFSDGARAQPRGATPARGQRRQPRGANCHQR